MPSRHKRAFLAITGIALAALGFALCWLLVLGEPGRSELRHAREKLLRDGLMRPLAELAPPPSAEEIANGWKLYDALAPLRGISRDYPAIVDASPMRFSAPGIAVVAADEPTPFFGPSSKNPPKSWDEFRTQLAAAGQVFTAASSILRQPTAHEYSYNEWAPRKDPIGEGQTYVSWLRADALLHIHDGDIPAAIDDIERIQQISAIIGRPGTLIRTVLSTGIWAFCLPGLTWEILQSPHAAEADLARLQAIVARGQFIADSARAAEIELYSMAGAYEHVRSRGSIWFTETRPDSLLFSTRGVAIRNALWPVLFADSDQARSLLAQIPDIEISRALLRTRSLRSIDSRLTATKAPLSTFDTWRFPFSATLAELATATTLKSATRYETVRQLTLAAIALQRYRIAHGAYPATLSELVPAYLPEMPHDWFDGQPLRYAPRDPGYLLYSVGKDLTDNSGDSTLAGTGDSSLTSGRDYVWPCPSR